MDNKEALAKFIASRKNMISFRVHNNDRVHVDNGCQVPFSLCGYESVLYRGRLYPLMYEKVCDPATLVQLKSYFVINVPNEIFGVK